MKISPTRWIPTVAGLLMLAGLFISLSHSFSDKQPSPSDVSSGEYDLVSEQAGESRQIRGPVYFEMDRKGGRADSGSILKLHFIHPEEDSGNGFGFLISLSEARAEVPVARFPIDPSKSGYSSGEPEVFGYADIQSPGASLYFTEAGSISILSSDADEITGEVNMVMKNTLGRQMRVRGRFSALPLQGNRSF